MASNTLTIVIEAVDKAKDKLGGIKASFTEINSAMQIAGQVSEVLQKAWDATAGAAVNYSLQIEKMQTVTGTSAQETSALVQVADDARVEFNTLQTAARNLADKGISPTIDNLADLADEYVAIQDPVKRTQFVMETFGTRAGPEMAKLLAQGGDALRKSGEEAKRYGGVTEESLQAAKDFASGMDSLQDSLESVKIEIGNALIPAANGLIDGWNNLIGGTKLLTDAFGKFEEDVAQSIVWNLATEDMVIAQANENVAKSYTLMAKQAEEANRVTRSLDTTIVTTADTLYNYQMMQYDAARATEDATVAAANEADQLVAVQAAISGPLASAYETYSEQSTNLNDRNVEITDQISKLREEYDKIAGSSLPANKQRAKELSDQIMGLTTEYYNNKNAQDAAAAAYDEATAKLIYQNAIAGLSAEQQLELGRSMGIVSESDYNLITATNKLNEKFQEDGDLKSYKDGLIKLKDAASDGKVTAGELETILGKIDGFTAEAVIDISVTGDEIPSFGGGKPGGADGEVVYQASGGPYYAGQPRVTGEYGQEFDVPMQNGVVIPNARTESIINNYWNMTINSTAQQSQNINLLRAVARA